jgi:hypothetical protein
MKWHCHRRRIELRLQKSEGVAVPPEGQGVTRTPEGQDVARTPQGQDFARTPEGKDVARTQRPRRRSDSEANTSLGPKTSLGLRGQDVVRTRRQRRRSDSEAKTSLGLYRCIVYPSLRQLKNFLCVWKFTLMHKKRTAFLAQNNGHNTTECYSPWSCIDVKNFVGFMQTPPVQ